MGGGGESKRKRREALFAALFNSLLAVSRGVSGMHRPPLCPESLSGLQPGRGISGPGASPGRRLCSTTGGAKCSLKGGAFITCVHVFTLSHRNTNYILSWCLSFTPLPKNKQHKPKTLPFGWTPLERKALEKAKCHYTWWPRTPSDLFPGKWAQLIPEHHVRVTCHRLSHKHPFLTKSDHLGRLSHFDGTGTLSTISTGQETILLIVSRQTKGFFSLGPVHYMLEHFLKYYLATRGHD